MAGVFLLDQASSSHASPEVPTDVGYRYCVTRRLTEFCTWFLQQKIASLIAGEVFDYGPVKSTVVHRQPPFQVELFIIRPGQGASDPHRHPDVDSIEVGLAGATLNFNRNGSIYRLGPGSMLRVRADDWHSVAELPQGAAFYSVQKWLNGVAPTSVGLNWEGTILSLAGAEHLSLMKQGGKWKHTARKKTRPS